MNITDRHAALLELQTADEVADFLRSKNIKGIPAMGDSCPIAKYLSKDLEEHLSIEVDLGSIYWHSNDEVEENEYGYEVYVNHTLEVTDAMSDFISLFDAGDDYLDLNQRSSYYFD